MHLLIEVLARFSGRRNTICLFMLCFCALATGQKASEVNADSLQTVIGLESMSFFNSDIRFRIA